MWNVYSVGDVSFLATVMRSAALFFSGSIPNTLAAIGLTIGVLYQGFRGSMSGEGISFGRILVTALLYLMFLVPKTDVSIEDCSTGESVAVSGVPLGPAFAASLISTMGYGVSKYVRQAFSGTEGTDNGYTSSIVILNDLRRKLGEVTVLQSVNNAGGGDFEKSWMNYFRECTHTGIDLGSMSGDMIFSAEDVVNASRLESSSFGTLINIDGHDELLTCSEAHSRLMAYTKSTYSEALFTELQNNYGTADGAREVVAFSGRDYRGLLNDAVSSLGLINTRAEDYVLSSVLLPVYLRAAKSRYLDSHATGSALALSQTVNAVNTASAVRQSVFFTMIRPLMTFFEALLFMLTPFMPLILMGTDSGLGLIGRYLGATVWVALWQPLLILVNVYLESAASGSLSVLNVAPQSFNGILAVNRRLETYISLGGYLSASVPVLAGVVLYGSASALNSVITGFAATAQQTAPHPVLEQRGGVVSHGSLFSNTPFTGMSRTGGSSVMSSVSLREGFREALSNAESEASSAERSFAGVLKNSMSEMHSGGLTHNRLESMGQRISSGTSESYGMIKGLAHTISKNTGISSSDEMSLRGALGLILSGAATEGDSAVAEAAGANSSRSSVERLKGELTRISGDDGIQAQFGRTVARDISKGSVSSDAYSLSRSSGRELSRAAGEAVSRREEAGRLKAFESSFGNGYSFDGVTLAKAVSGNARALEMLRSEFAGDHTLSARANGLRSVMESIMPDSGQARVAGELRALLEKNPAKAVGVIAAAFDIKGANPAEGELREVKGAYFKDTEEFQPKMNPVTDIPYGTLNMGNPGSGSGSPGSGRTSLRENGDSLFGFNSEADRKKEEEELSRYYSDFLKNRSRVKFAFADDARTMEKTGK